MTRSVIRSVNVQYNKSISQIWIFLNPRILIRREELIMGKKGFIQLQNWMREGVFSALALKLDHLQPIEPIILQKNFIFFFLFHTGRPIFITPEGIHPTSKVEWDRGFSVPGAFKLDYLQPFEPILSQKISNFSTFILGGQFLLPQRANNGKWDFTQL